MIHIRKLHRSTLIGILFTIIIGTLLHFVFDFASHNRIVAFFSPVNQSTWENLKLLFFPFLFYSIYEYFRLGAYFNHFLVAKVIGILIGLSSIIIIFYTYSGIIGEHYLFADIIIFILGVMITFTVSTKIMKRTSNLSFVTHFFSILFVFLLIFCFFYFTFYPPEINLFLDPVTKIYSSVELK